MAELSEADIFAAAGPGGPQNREVEPPEPNDATDPHATVRAQEERPTPNLGQLPDQGGDEGQAVQTQEPPRRTMLDDLKEERKRRQDFERQLAERDRERAELHGRMRQMEQVFGQLQNRPVQQEAPRQPEPAPDPFQDPEGFNRHIAHMEMRRVLGPYFEQQQQREQQFAQVVQGLQRSTAAARYGDDAAREAEEAFNTAAARGTIDPHEHRRINTSPNPYAAAVEWHQRQRTLSTVGDDPEKWFGTEMQRRIQQDPAFKQQVFDLLQGQAQQGQAAGANSPAAGRQPPVFTGLASLNAAPGSSGRENGVMSESDLFNAAPAKFGGKR